MAPAKSLTRTEVRVALALTTALVLALVLANAFLFDPRGFDFSAMYTGGLILRRDGASELYDLAQQAKVEKSLFGRPNLLPYDHPPFEALFIAPITKFNYRTAYALWGVANVLLLLLFQHLFRPFAPVPRRCLHYFMLCFLFFPVWVALMQGQMAILLLVLFSLTFIHLERGHDYRAGFFISLGLFKFPIVLPFALICFLRGKWKLMMGFAAGALLLGGASLIAVGPDGILAYVHVLFDALRNNADPAFVQITRDLPTLRGFLATIMVPWAGHSWIEATAIISAAIMILVTASLWRRHDRLPRGGESRMMFAAALVVSLVTSPYALTHDLSLMLIAILLVVGSQEWSTKSSK